MSRGFRQPLQRDASSLGSLSSNVQPSLGELEHKAKWELRSNLSEILARLDIDEVISLLFLVMSTSDLANKGYAWMHYAQQDNIHENLSQMVEHPEALKAILEALYVIQRFDILHDLGLCATHGFFRKVCASLDSISPCRKILYRVFTGLTQTEANDIVTSLGWKRPVDGELLELTFTRNLTPNNYDILIFNLGQKLQQHGFVQLSDYLRPFYPHVSDIHPVPALTPSSPMPPTTPPLTMDLYPLPSSTPHGLCIIINIKEFIPPKADDRNCLGTRYGSDIDVRRLQGTFKLMGFIVAVKENLDQEGIQHIFKKLRTDTLSTWPCLVVVVMSHGDEDHVFLHDRKCIKVSKLRDLCFANSLIGKPRLFFVQACRGDEALRPVFLVKDSGFDPYKTNHSQDCLISYSTIQGYSSFRSTTEGSCYITYLCETLQMYGDKEPISRVLQRTREKMCAWVEEIGGQHVTQMSEEQSTLTKDVQLCRGDEEYFVHGIFDLVTLEVIEKVLSDIIDDLVTKLAQEEEPFEYESLPECLLAFSMN